MKNEFKIKNISLSFNKDTVKIKNEGQELLVDQDVFVEYMEELLN